MSATTVPSGFWSSLVAASTCCQDVRCRNRCVPRFLCLPFLHLQLLLFTVANAYSCVLVVISQLVSDSGRTPRSSATAQQPTEPMTMTTDTEGAELSADKCSSSNS